jgi:hypothetical protein
MSEENKTWLDKAKETHKYHSDRLRYFRNHESQTNWTVAKTATALHRSIGSVGEDLTIIRWMRIYGEEISKFDYQYEALAFIRKKKKELELGD